MLITNINTTPRNIRKNNMPKVLENSPWKKKKIKTEKRPRKSQKKREQSPDQKVAWEILSKPLVFCLVLSRLFWLTRILTGFLCA